MGYPIAGWFIIEKMLLLLKWMISGSPYGNPRSQAGTVPEPESRRFMAAVRRVGLPRSGVS